jgi:hypothetical protein
MTEYKFFSVEDETVTQIEYEFVLNNPTELIVRDTTNNKILLRFKNWVWNVEKLNIIDYINFSTIDDGGYVNDENHDLAYIVPFTSFGVYDYKFSFRDSQKSHEIFMTTNVPCDEVNRPITFSNFEVFDKLSSIGEVKSIVFDYGFVFVVEDSSNVEGTNNTFSLYFDNPLSGIDRIRVYQSDYYKDGVTDFHVFQEKLDLWKNIKGFNTQRSDFLLKRICHNKYYYYHCPHIDFSLILFEDRTDRLLDIYKEICDMVAHSIYLTKNMKTDLELIILRWFSEKFNSSNLKLLDDIVTLHDSIDSFINSASRLRSKVSSVSDKNGSLYK